MIKKKVAELPVTHESEDSSEVVKYRENPDVIEHDVAKDKKGSVVVKYVDGQGNEIDTAVTVKDNVIVEKQRQKFTRIAKKLLIQLQMKNIAL